MDAHTAMEPIITTLKGWTIGLFVIMGIYGICIFWLKSKIKERRRFVFFKNLLHLLTFAIMIIWTYNKFR